MKRLLTLIMLLPLMSVAQETSDKPKKEKTKHFELWASVGMGNRDNIGKPDYTYSKIGSHYFVNKKYTPDYALRVGTAVCKSVHVGVRFAMSTMYYEHWSHGEFYGNPMIRLGVYGKYTLPLGKLSPYVCGRVSWAHLPLEYPGIENVYDGMGYGTDIGAKYSILPKLAVTGEIQLSYAKVQKNSIELDFYQKGASVGVLFSF